MAEKRRRRRSKEHLIEDEEQGTGVSNPTLDDETETYYQAFSQSQTEGETSAAEMIEENERAQVLKGELKSRHRRRRRELSKLTTPKDDVTGELKTVKMDSRKKLEETEQEADELAKALDDARVAADTSVLAAGAGDVEPALPSPARDKDVQEEEKVAAPVSPPQSPAPPKSPEPAEAVVAEETAPAPTLERTTSKDEGEITDRRRSTMRERMKSRLAKAKEEAETEIEKQERDERKRTLKGKKETRFEEMDEQEIAKLEERTERMRKRRIERSKQQDAMSFMPTPEQSFDFFTREWEEEPEEAEKPKEEDEVEEKEKKPDAEEPETEEERAAKEESKEETALLVDDQEYTEESYGPVAIRKAYMDDAAVIDAAEQKMLFHPSSVRAPSTEKVGGELEPRFLEDEGFYVGVKPFVADKNRSRMEDRILKESQTVKEAANWFGEDGQLIILPDPLREAPTRPTLVEDTDMHAIDTIFYKAIMREFDSRYIDGAVDGGGFYQLDVDVNSISFTHHHLFSREHVLAHKLTLLHSEHVARAKRDMAGFLTEKLSALKNSALLLQDYIASHKGEMTVVDRDNYERRLRDYKSEISQTRYLRDKEEQTDRTLLKSIIHTWRELKTLREQQKFVNTPVKLQIRKEDTDKEEDLAKWKLEMEEETFEEKEKFEEEFMRKEAVYKDQLEKYEKQALEKEEAQKRILDRNRQKKRRGSKSSKGSKASKNSQERQRAETEDDLDNDSLEEENAKDQAVIDTEPLPKPEPPEALDERTLKDQIKAKFMAQKRRPGEPKLFPELSNSATVTPSSQCTRSEQQRRDDVSKVKLYVKILFNGKEVSRTGPRPLSQDFNVNFGEIYNLKIVEWPESIKFEIYETAGFGSGRLLAELFAPIPESSVTSQSVALENVEFSSYEKIQFSHDGVGSGVAFKFEGHVPDLVTLMTSGVLNSSVAWAVGEDGLPLVPTEKFGASYKAATQIKRLDPFTAIGASGVSNLEKLLEWFKQSRLDPNDPNNKDIVYMLSGGEQTLLAPREYFRLEPLQQEFDLTTLEEIEKSLRYKIISLRDQENPIFKGYQMIPSLEREIPKDALKEYEKKQREETQMPHVKGDLEHHRAQVNLYLQKIKERVTAQYRFASHQKTLQDVVNEDTVPNITMIATSLLRLSEPRRPLRPVRKERKKVTAQALDGKEVKILINIIRASYIPVRKAVRSPGTSIARDVDGSAITDTYEDLVCPFVEVMFQRSRVRTWQGEGPNPSFNEELELILRVPNDDYSPSSLQAIEDDIFINLFDEVTVDVLEDNRERETNIHQRIEKKWLGSIKIPFSTVYFNNKIDGTFRINTPPFLLGYTYDMMQAQPGASEVETTIGRGSSYLSMFVTIEPSLSLPEPFKEKLATTEEEELIERADAWQAELERQFPKRIYKTTVMDTMGKNVFVTRYFRSIKPPPEVEACTDPQKAMEMAARYVSMIPFVADTALFPGQCDIWSTCNQFMKMLCGDEEEHAVLLTNYFLAMGKTAYLILGNAIPEGQTAYVLTCDADKYHLWNARTGESYSVHDNYCPIQSIGCLINAENIWANIQEYEKPSQMDFNLTNTSCWLSFYNKSYLNRGLASVQPAELFYFRKDKKFDSMVLELQERIEQMLKNKIMEWRSRYITRWNRHCTQIMRKLLPLLEEIHGKQIEQSHLRDLEESFKSYKVSGFPLNLPFTDMTSITEAVFSTGVHSKETSDVEFALAVYVHGYTNNVMSVWVYVASLIRLR
ncbi:hypothetical protein EGW08_019997 [Elysia chlorotica]|uniref:C2 domain-containing protein n=1 Tax=Elysia chlorotica TaxID=188477 RepID=A0A433SSJ7_ELYCH|nr:hypothetical protein EGW08_019997 [Elysia chlorotica]